MVVEQKVPWDTLSKICYYCFTSASPQRFPRLAVTAFGFKRYGILRASERASFYISQSMIIVLQLIFLKFFFVCIITFLNKSFTIRNDLRKFRI